MRNGLMVLFALFPAIAATAQTPEPATAKALASHDTSMDRRLEEVIKDIDDVRWSFPRMSSPRRLSAERRP